jgi:hypothetical protein
VKNYHKHIKFFFTRNNLLIKNVVFFRLLHFRLFKDSLNDGGNNGDAKSDDWERLRGMLSRVAAGLRALAEEDGFAGAVVADRAAVRKHADAAISLKEIQFHW